MQVLYRDRKKIPYAITMFREASKGEIHKLTIFNLIYDPKLERLLNLGDL